MGGRHGQGRGPAEPGWAALRQLAEPCGHRGRHGGRSGRPRTPACPEPRARPCHLPHGADSLIGGGGETDGPRRRLRVEASRRPHFLLRHGCAAASAGGMAAAAARGSGRASACRLLLLLLLVPLLWAPAGVRAAPDEDLSHRNKEPPAPAQQLQPQPAAGQGPEPARAEVSRTGRARLRRVPGSWPPERRPRPGAAGGGGEPCRQRSSRVRPGLARLLGRLRGRERTDRKSVV